MKLKPTPIYVISLPYAQKRRAYIHNQMENHKIIYNFFDAVDGNDLTKADLSKYKIKEGESMIRRPLAKGELGCTLTHFNIYKKMLKENITKSIILEDDVEINYKLPALINSLEDFDFHWDLLYFGWTTPFPAKPFIWQNVYPLNIWHSHRLKIGGIKDRHYAGYPVVPLERSHAYAITLKGAAKLHDRIKNHPFVPIDVFFEYSSIKERLAIAPCIAEQLFNSREIEQHITPERIIYQRIITPDNSLKRKISKNITLCLNKTNPRFIKYWEEAKLLRRKLISTWRVISPKYIS